MGGSEALEIALSSDNVSPNLLQAILRQDQKLHELEVARLEQQLEISRLQLLLQRSNNMKEGMEERLLAANAKLWFSQCCLNMRGLIGECSILNNQA